LWITDAAVLLDAVDDHVESALGSVEAEVVVVVEAAVAVAAAVVASTYEAWEAQQTTWSLARRLNCCSRTTTSA